MGARLHAGRAGAAAARLLACLAAYGRLTGHECRHASEMVCRTSFRSAARVSVGARRVATRRTRGNRSLGRVSARPALSGRLGGRVCGTGAPASAAPVHARLPPDGRPRGGRGRRPGNVRRRVPRDRPLRAAPVALGLAEHHRCSGSPVGPPAANAATRSARRRWTRSATRTRRPIRDGGDGHDGRRRSARSRRGRRIAAEARVGDRRTAISNIARPW